MVGNHFYFSLESGHKVFFKYLHYYTPSYYWKQRFLHLYKAKTFYDQTRCHIFLHNQCLATVKQLTQSMQAENSYFETSYRYPSVICSSVFLFDRALELWSGNHSTFYIALCQIYCLAQINRLLSNNNKKEFDKVVGSLPPYRFKVHFYKISTKLERLLQQLEIMLETVK